MSIGAVEGPLTVLEVQEHTDPGLQDLLHEVGDLDLLAPQAGLLAHDQDLEDRARSECAHQAGEPWTFDEFRSADAVIDVDVFRGDPPPLPRSVGPRGAGEIAEGMQRAGWDLQLTEYGDRNWRATFYVTGLVAATPSAHRLSLAP